MGEFDWRDPMARAASRGVLLAVLATPVAADECSDYRTAFVLYEAALQASMDHAQWLAEDISRMHERSRPEYDEAELRTFRALDDAARAVQRTIDDEAKAVVIHAIVAARDTVELARHLTVRAPPGPLSPASKAAYQSGGPTLATAFAKLSTAFRETKAAYHDALHFVCFERDFEREQRP